MKRKRDVIPRGHAASAAVPARKGDANGRIDLADVVWLFNDL